jgi:CRP/FNR family transcriptional regulator, dissimilatory nitrate respiration regulator
MIDQLILSPFFAGLTTEEIENILQNVHYQVIKHKKGDILHLAGEPVDVFMIVLQGCVRGEMVDTNGKIFIMEDICAPRAVSPGFIYGNFNRFPVNVVASENSVVIKIAKFDLDKILILEPRIMFNFLAILSNKTQHLALKIKSIFLQNIEGKIASYLLDLAHENESNSFVLTKSQTWLAERFNVARPSIARVFADMKAKGYIEMDDHLIVILNPKALNDCINRV